MELSFRWDLGPDPLILVKSATLAHRHMSIVTESVFSNLGH